MIDQDASSLRALQKIIVQIFSNQTQLEINQYPLYSVEETKVLVVFNNDKSLVTRELIEFIPKDCILFDGGIGSIPSVVMQLAHRRNLKILRPDMRTMLASELSAALAVREMVENTMGRTTINGVPIVAGGLVGRYGDIVTDSITNPTKVLGVADGHGLVIYQRTNEFKENLEKVEAEIFQNQIAPNRDER